MKTRLRVISSMDILFWTIIALGFLPSLPTALGATVQANKDKLLVIMLDGFRWDYYSENKNSLNAFQQFLSEGVQAEWVETIFPAISFAAWTTISTGVEYLKPYWHKPFHLSSFSETHGVLGNYMFDKDENDPDQALFSLDDLDTTMLPKWWENSEPIWTTATKQGKKTFLRFWDRCDVPFQDILPHEGTGYQAAPGAENVSITFNIAFEKLQEDYDLVMVYGEHIDNIGHQFGPNSPELKQALIDIDGALNDLLDKLIDSHLEETVNIIILSDHGMTWTGQGSGVKYINMDDYLESSEIYRIMDRGSVMSISPYPQYYQRVLDRLRAVTGIEVYKKEDIPEEYHYKGGRLALEILLVAKENYFIRGLQTDRQIPRDKDPNGISNGLHGYAKMIDMRTIFFAKGPAFKKGIVHPPINLEDEYQIFAKLLDIQAQPHNGSWDRVADMFSSAAVAIPLLNVYPILFTAAFSLYVNKMIIN